MDIKVERIAGGSRVTMLYRAAGFANGGADKLAPVVDKVLGEQIKRYRDHLAAAAARARARDQGGVAKAGRDAARLMVLRGDLGPLLARAQVGHGHVAVDFGQHLGQLDPVGDRLEHVEDRRPADDRDGGVARRPRSNSSSEWTVSTPSWRQSGSRVRTMCWRPGSTPGRLSKVLRPMIIALPMVSALKRLRSAGMCHGSVPSLPITPLMARARTMVIGGRDVVSSGQALVRSGTVGKRPSFTRQAEGPAD